MRRLSTAAFVFATVALFGATARADLVGLGKSGAGPANYAVLGLGGGTVNLSLVTVTGNVGIGAGGKVTNQAPSKIVGNVYESAVGQYSGPGALTGSDITNATLLAQNVAGANAAATNAAKLAATQSFGNITTATTITGVAGLNVIDVNGNINLNNANLTLSGPAGAAFILNVTGDISLVGTAALAAKGVTSSDILYNLTAANATVQTNIGDSVDGILLAAGNSSSMTLDGAFNGEVVGQAITLMSGATVQESGPIDFLPEPSALALLPCGLLMLGVVIRKRRVRV